MTTATHPSRDDVDDEAVNKVRSLIEGVRTCMLTSIDRDGGLISRPMAVQEVEFDGDLWFFSEADSPKVANVTADPAVNVAFVDGSMWVSLKGRAEVVDDAAKKEELWNPFVAAWFTHEPADPAIVLIRVHSDSAEYWDSPGAAATALSMLKSTVTRGTPNVGNNEVVDL